MFSKLCILQIIGQVNVLAPWWHACYNAYSACSSSLHACRRLLGGMCWRRAPAGGKPSIAPEQAQTRSRRAGMSCAHPTACSAPTARPCVTGRTCLGITTSLQLAPQSLPGCVVSVHCLSSTSSCCMHAYQKAPSLTALVRLAAGTKAGTGRRAQKARGKAWWAAESHLMREYDPLSPFRRDA